MEIAVQVCQRSEQRDAGYQFYVFCEHYVPGEPPFFLLAFPPSQRLYRPSISSWNVGQQQTQTY